MPEKTPPAPHIVNLVERLSAHFEMTHPYVTPEDLSVTLRNWRERVTPPEFSEVLHMLRKAPATPPPEALARVAAELGERYASRNRVREAVKKVCPNISTRQKNGLEDYFRLPEQFQSVTEEMIVAIGRLCVGKPCSRANVRAAARSLGYHLKGVDMNAIAARLRIEDVNNAALLSNQTRDLLSVLARKAGVSMQTALHRAIVDSALRMLDTRTPGFDPRSEDTFSAMRVMFGLQTMVVRQGTSTTT